MDILMIFIINFTTFIVISSRKYKNPMFTSIYKVKCIINMDVCLVQIKYRIFKLRIPLENNFYLKFHLPMIESYLNGERSQPKIKFT